MHNLILGYIGPGIGIGGIVLIGIILLIILASIVMVIWIPLRNFIRKMIQLFKK